MTQGEEQERQELRQEIARLHEVLRLLIEMHPGCLLPAHQRVMPFTAVPVADIIAAGVKALDLVVVPHQVSPGKRALYLAMIGADA